MAIPRGCLPAHEVAHRIKQWLEAEEFDCVVLIGEFARNTLFSYHVTVSGTEITVYQPSDKKDSIIVSATLFLSDDQVKRLRKKPKDIQEKTFTRILIKLAPLDVELTLEGGEICQRIGINHHIYFDGLTKDRFFRTIFTVNKAFRLVEWILEQSL